jgi:hypothetical protein
MPAALAAGRLNGDSSGESGRLQLQALGQARAAVRDPQAQVSEDLLDEALIQDGGDDPQLAGKPPAMSGSNWPAV